MSPQIPYITAHRDVELSLRIPKEMQNSSYPCCVISLSFCRARSITADTSFSGRLKFSIENMYVETHFIFRKMHIASIFRSIGEMGLVVK